MQMRREPASYQIQGRLELETRPKALALILEPRSHCAHCCETSSKHDTEGRQSMEMSQQVNMCSVCRRASGVQAVLWRLSITSSWRSSEKVVTAGCLNSQLMFGEMHLLYVIIHLFPFLDETLDVIVISDGNN